MFLCARIGAGRPLADQMRTLVALKEEGHFDHIGMSECSARSVREAFTVCCLSLYDNAATCRTDKSPRQVTPIAAVEIEVSPWSYEEETRNGTYLNSKEFTNLLRHPDAMHKSLQPVQSSALR
jgi:pyridoxine 4-dehydrogenase